VVSLRFAWIDERPFNYMQDGRLVGCDVALARRAIQTMGEPFEPVHTTFGELLAGLADGRWEVTTGMFVTRERQALAHFTRPIWSLSDGLLVAEHATWVGGYRDLAATGSRLAVLHGQVQVDHALQNGVRREALVMLDSYDEAAASVERGDVTAYASVSLAHQEYLSHTRDDVLRLVRVPADEVAASEGAFACASVEVRDALDLHLSALVDADNPAEPSPDPGSWVGDCPGD
jgi:polar amino acid transport system substrate-binding protein